MTTTRLLAAILAADVAGYSRLIGSDVYLVAMERGIEAAIGPARLPLPDKPSVAVLPLE